MSSISTAPRAVRPGRDTGLPKVSVIIPVLNDAAGLERCLNSIYANNYPATRLEVIVADNGSTDGSAEMAARAGATVMRLPGSSVAAMRNRVSVVASGEVLAFVDADHELSSGWLRSAVDALARPGIAAVGAPYHPPSNGTWVQRLYDAFRTHNSEPAETRWLGSGNLAVWTSAFVATGGFDTSLTACEDVDLCQRLRNRGLRLLSDERLRSVHYGDPRTLKQLFMSELWRGRDNLVVSCRGPLSVRDIPSIVIPLLVLVSLFALPAATITAAFGMPLPLLFVLALTLAAPAARAAVMVRRLAVATPLDYLRALVVASTYDVARALALVTRAAHRRAA